MIHQRYTCGCRFNAPDGLEAPAVCPVHEKPVQDQLAIGVTANVPEAVSRKARSVDFLRDVAAALELDRPIRSFSVSADIDGGPPVVRIEFFLQQAHAGQVAKAIGRHRAVLCEEITTKRDESKPDDQPVDAVHAALAWLFRPGTNPRLAKGVSGWAYFVPVWAAKVPAESGTVHLVVRRERTSAKKDFLEFVVKAADPDASRSVCLAAASELASRRNLMSHEGTVSVGIGEFGGNPVSEEGGHVSRVRFSLEALS
jgi:hypothetical protein